jgi:hypothetical protein
MTAIKPDIVVDVRFYATSEGGRHEPTTDRHFSCPFRFEGELFDCLLLLEKTGPIRPGQRAVVPIKFLRPDVIKDMLSTGQRFQLWDMRPFAEGQIIEVCGDAGGQVLQSDI